MLEPNVMIDFGWLKLGQKIIQWSYNFASLPIIRVSI